MLNDNTSNTEPQPSSLPPARLPEGHQPVNTELVVRGAGQQGVETKIIRADQKK